MRTLKQVVFTLATTIATLNAFGQANPFINVLPDNSGIVAVGCPVDLIVTVGNSGPTANVPQAKLRPIIQVPPSCTFLPTAQQTGLPAGWTILSNTGSQIRVCNSTDPIPVSTSRIIILKAQGVTVTPPQTFSGNINFGNGTTCAAGTTVLGDLTTDNSATSTIEVIAAPTLTITSALAPFSTTTGTPSSEQVYTLSGSNITEDITINAPTSFEVSNTSGTGFASTATVTPAAGILSNYPVYLRLSAAANVGTFSGNVVNASVSPTCVAPQTISVTGVVNATPLSVALIDFSIKADKCTAQLNWMASSITNSKKFDVERFETNSGTWKTIGSVMAQGNTTANTTYNFKDDNVPVNNNVVYRLKLINKDGSFTYSHTLNAAIKCNGQNLAVYPNPVAHGKLIVSLGGAQQIDANLTTVTGQYIKTITLKQGLNNIDVSELSNGVFILSARFAQGVSQSIKVNIQK